MITTEAEEKAKKAQQAKKKVKKEVPKKEEIKIPMGYIRVRLDSLGKLSAPFELHFRDYSIEEAMELASTNDEVDNLSTMISILNSMVLEDFDCGELTLQELYEILYTIQGTFYSPTIEKTVLIDETKDPKDKENQIPAVIPLSSIETKEIEKEFKEPFYLVDDKMGGAKYGFRLPRVKDKVTVENFLTDKYRKETRQYSDILYKIRKIEAISNTEQRLEKMQELEVENFDEIREFQSYLLSKGKLMLALTQAMSLVSIDGEEVEYGDCEKLLELIPKISSRVWKTYTEIVDKYDFGLQEEVTFFSPELGESITRRLVFRHMDFLPTGKSEDDTGVTFSFS